jgi:hypothetical protein
VDTVEFFRAAIAGSDDSWWGWCSLDARQQRRKLQVVQIGCLLHDVLTREVTLTLFVVRPEPSCAVVFRSIFGSPLYDSLLTRTLRHSRHFAEQGAKGTLDHFVMVRIVWSFPCFQRLKGSGRLCCQLLLNHYWLLGVVVVDGAAAKQACAT